MLKCATFGSFTGHATLYVILPENSFIYLALAVAGWFYDSYLTFFFFFFLFFLCTL